MNEQTGQQKDLRYLQLLSRQYPNVQAASSEIINLQAILNLPKGTEHFMSDLHGEYEAFLHIMNNASGAVREKVDILFQNMVTSEERAQLATLIYYPELKLKQVQKQEPNLEDWYRVTIYRLIRICKAASSKYTRSKVRKSLPQDLLSVRRRANAFDEHTASESRVAMLLLLQLCVCEGLMMFMWLGAGEAAGQTVVTVAALAGLAGAFYLFQLGACVTVGYVFTDSVGDGMWRQGLNASQMLLGVVLTVPTLVALFYPGVSGVMLAIAAGLYILSRICYISKGFRIFYTNFPSLLYFILYLCTLEIIPVITILILAREICVNLK